MISISKLRSAFYLFKNGYLFQRFAFPKVKNEQISKSVIKKYLPVSPVIVDCGAYDGTDACELAQILKGTVYAFEAVPEIYEALRKKTAKYPSIKCLNIALSNMTGKQSLFVSAGRSDASSSLLEPKEHLNDHPDTHFTTKIDVDTIKLDDWAQTNSIDKIDMLWLDMQGFELKMLQASPKILKSVSVIHTEVSLKETYAGVELYSAYKSFLETNGFYVLIEAIPEGWDMGNVLFVRK